MKVVFDPRYLNNGEDTKTFPKKSTTPMGSNNFNTKPY